MSCRCVRHRPPSASWARAALRLGFPTQWAQVTLLDLSGLSKVGARVGRGGSSRGRHAIVASSRVPSCPHGRHARRTNFAFICCHASIFSGASGIVLFLPLYGRLKPRQRRVGLRAWAVPQIAAHHHDSRRSSVQRPPEARCRGHSSGTSPAASSSARRDVLAAGVGLPGPQAHQWTEALFAVIGRPTHRSRQPARSDDHSSPLRRRRGQTDSRSSLVQLCIAARHAGRVRAVSETPARHR